MELHINNQILKNMSSTLSKYQADVYRKDFPKIDRHTGGKWLIHGPKYNKDNRSQSLKYPAVQNIPVGKATTTKREFYM